MNLNDIFRELLVEGILEAIGQKESDIRDKWQRISDLPEMRERDTIYCNKVTPVSDELLQKIFNTSQKYMGWILNLYKKDFAAPKIVNEKPLPLEDFKKYEARFAEDLYKIGDDLKIFAFDSVRGKITKDLGLSKPVTIDQFQTAAQLYDAVKPYMERKFDSNSDQVKHDTLVFKGDVFDVYVPTTKEQSCTLGGDTRWCTAAHGKDNMFDHYNGKGKLYILINRSNPTEKYQFHFESEQFMDREDKAIEETDIYQKDNSFLKFLFDKSVEGDIFDVYKNKNNNKIFFLNKENKEIDVFSESKYDVKNIMSVVNIIDEDKKLLDYYFKSKYPVIFKGDKYTLYSVNGFVLIYDGRFINFLDLDDNSDDTHSMIEFKMKNTLTLYDYKKDEKLLFYLLQSYGYNAAKQFYNSLNLIKNVEIKELILNIYYLNNLRQIYLNEKYELPKIVDGDFYKLKCVVECTFKLKLLSNEKNIYKYLSLFQVYSDLFKKMNYVDILQKTIDFTVPLNFKNINTFIVENLDYFKEERLYSYFADCVIKHNTELSGVCFRELLVSTENYDMLFRKIVNMYIKSDVPTKFFTQSISYMTNTDSINYLKIEFEKKK